MRFDANVTLVEKQIDADDIVWHDDFRERTSPRYQQVTLRTQPPIETRLGEEFPNTFLYITNISYT